MRSDRVRFRVGAATLAMVSLLVLAACGGETAEKGAGSGEETEPTPSDSAPSDSSTPAPPESPSSPPSDDINIESDFSESGNPDDWDEVSLGRSYIAIQDGYLHGQLTQRQSLYTYPDELEFFEASNVTATVTPVGFGPGNPLFGIACMIQTKGRSYAAGYEMVVSAQGFTAVSKVSRTGSRAIVPPTRVPGWDRDDPRPVNLACSADQDGSGVAFAVSVGSGEPVAVGVDDRKALGPGLVRYLVTGSPREFSGVDVAGIDLYDVR